MNGPHIFTVTFDDAIISECGQYRYRLTRRITPHDLGHFGCDGHYRYTPERIANFIMLNPSTADWTTNDPTIRRCIGYAMAWGCAALVVSNLFGFRATDPRYIAIVRDPVGPLNNDYVIGAACRAHESGGVVVAAWGVNGWHRDQDRHVMSLLTQTLGIPVKCMGTTAEGFPRHPLYLTRKTPLAPYAGRPLMEVKPRG
jgi:hypothetical protein